MARGAPDYQERAFTAETLLGEDNILHESDAWASPGGNPHIDLGPVPIGHYWKVEHITAYDITSPIDLIQPMLHIASDYFPIARLLTPGANDLFVWDGTLWMADGWMLEIYFNNTNVGDWIAGFANGVEIIRR